MPTVHDTSVLEIQQLLNRLVQAARVPPIPGLQDTDRLALLRYLRPKHREAARCGFSAGTYTHGATAENYAYAGGVYSPTQNRIYFVPDAQADVAEWHYIQDFSGVRVSPNLMAHGLFNKL